MKKQSLLRRLLPGVAFFVGGMAVGALAAWGGLHALPELGFSRPQMLLVLGLALLLYVVGIAIHEGGHVLGGRLAGFRTLLYIVGPLKLERTATGFQAGLNRSVMQAGGLVAMVPVGLHDLRQRTLLLVAGGPVVSLMVGAQFLAIYQAAAAYLLRDGAPFAAQLTAVCLLILGGASILIGVVTLIPGRSGGFYTDGARMLRLMRATEETEREVALVALIGMSMAGTRPRDWDTRLVTSGAAVSDGGPFEVLGRQLAYAHSLDRGNVEEARVHLEGALERIGQIPAGARGSLLLSAATFFALYDGDAPRARGYLQQARGGLMPAAHQRQMAEAAVRLAEGDVEGARDAARRVQDLAASAMDRGSAALDIALAGRILVADDG